MSDAKKQTSAADPANKKDTDKKEEEKKDAALPEEVLNEED